MVEKTYYGSLFKRALVYHGEEDVVEFMVVEKGSEDAASCELLLRKII